MVLIYDNDCDFCGKCANWLRARGEVPVAPDSEVSRLTYGLTLEETKASVWWVDDGIRFRGHQAIGQALRPLGGFWALVGLLIRTPPISWFGAIAYRWVATNRCRFG